MQEERQPSSLTLIDPRIFQLASAISLLLSYIWSFFPPISLYLIFVSASRPSMLAPFEGRAPDTSKNRAWFPFAGIQHLSMSKTPQDFRICQSIFKDLMSSSNLTEQDCFATPAQRSICR